MERYREILEQLTPQQLIVVALRVEYDLGLAEIGQELGITKQAVSCRLNGAAKAIRRGIPDLAYEARRPRTYKRPDRGPGLSADEVAFMAAMIDLSDRGEPATISAIARELARNRKAVYRTFQKLLDRGLVEAGPPMGRALPLYLTGDPWGSDNG